MILHIEGTRRKDQTLVLGTWEPVITTWFPPDFLIPPARARKPGEDRSKERVASSPKVAGTNLADAPWRKPIGRRNVVHEHESDNQTNISGRCYSVRKFSTTTAMKLRIWPPPSKRTFSQITRGSTMSFTRADGANREGRNSSPLTIHASGFSNIIDRKWGTQAADRVAQEPRSSILSLLQLSGGNFMFFTPQAHEERQADTSNRKTTVPQREGKRDAGARATLRFQGGANFLVQDTPVFLSAPAGHSRVLQELGRGSRNRLQECYLNGFSLLRSISCGAFPKVPFFLRHLWHAVAE